MLFEVRYTVYQDQNKINWIPELWNCAQTIQAISPYQAQAIIEAQFNGRAVVDSVRQVG